MPDQKTRKPLANGAAGAKPKHTTTGSYFLSLEIENVRCFSNMQVLDLSDGQGRPARWTILLGENGTGKTTALQLLGAFERAVNRTPEAFLFRSHENFVALPWREFDILARGRTAPQLKFATKMVRGSIINGTVDNNPSHSWRIEYDSSRFLLITASDLRPPICYAYGTDRHLGTSSMSPDEAEEKPQLLFLERTRLRNAEEWLLRLDYSASKTSKIQGKQKELLGLVIHLLIKVLPEVDGIRFTQPTAKSPTPGVQFKTPYGWVSLRQLGHGYRKMIAWIVDLASRMVERYPDSANPLAEPAVVLIDEIDLHLHPKWQRDLIGYLTKLFPNTQFIATAHSPLIVQAATGANIALLKREGDHVIIENNPETIRGWRIDQILTSDLFGLETARPPELEKPLLRRRELLTKPKLTKADKKELKELEANLGTLPAGESFEQAKTMALLEQSLQMLKGDQGH